VDPKLFLRYYRCTVTPHDALRVAEQKSGNVGFNLIGACQAGVFLTPRQLRDLITLIEPLAAPAKAEDSEWFDGNA